MASEDAVQELVDLEEIRRLKARYVLFLDSHLYDDLRTVFTADARLGGPNAPLDAFQDSEWIDLDRFIAAVGARHASLPQIHLIHSPILVLTSPSEARGLWSFSSSALRGYYEDEYRKEDGRWRISATRYNVIVPHDEARLEREAPFVAAVAETLRDLAARWRA